MRHVNVLLATHTTEAKYKYTCDFMYDTMLYSYNERKKNSAK